MREEKLAYWRTYHATHAATANHRRRAAGIQQRYGITAERAADMLKEQRGECAVCSKANKRLVIDHDHKTGQVRGLVCDSCNRSLAALDNAEWLERARIYLAPKGVVT